MASAFLEVRVAAIRPEAPGICSFELAPASKQQALPAFSAGSHIDVFTPAGQVRQYSMCNDPSESHRYVIGVLRDPKSRGGSESLHRDVRVGDILRISTPRNHFPLAGDAGKSLLVGGGIGITPILCMAERLHTLGRDFEMHYYARARERAAFLGRIAGSNFSSRVHLHFDEESGGTSLNAAELLSVSADTHLYVCGPQGFMDQVLANARAAGWAQERLHLEFFSNTQSHQRDGAFKLQLASSGRVLEVAEGQTAADALEAAGVPIMLSCGEGVCGTCVTRVLEGIPEHRDLYLSDSEHALNQHFTPCCSRAKTPLLVLDL
jgi:vanillate O-demethylase ferredoxin subunit